MMQAISTTTVPWMTWFWVGHSTFFSSPHDSATKRRPPPPVPGGAPGARLGLDRLGRPDLLLPRPRALLEAGARAAGLLLLAAGAALRSRLACHG